MKRRWKWNQVGISAGGSNAGKMASISDEISVML